MRGKKQTHKLADHNTSHPNLGRSKTID